MNNLRTIITKEISSLASPEKEKGYLRFFKTGKGEYGEGDKFLGLTSPQLGTLVRKYYKEISFEDIEFILHSPIHEYRMFALSCMVHKFEKYPEERDRIYRMYLVNTKWINNWDLVDVTAPKIVGNYLLDKDRSILYSLSKSKDLWEQRISILSTFPFITNNELKDTFKISDNLLNHKHDLIHKAVGWMLREVGNKNLEAEMKFLETRYKNMPRTMLRYSIEKFEESLRQKYLKGQI